MKTCDTCFFNKEFVMHTHYMSRRYTGADPWTKKRKCFVGKEEDRYVGYIAPQNFPESNTCDKWSDEQWVIVKENGNKYWEERKMINPNEIYVIWQEGDSWKAMTYNHFSVGNTGLVDKEFPVGQGPSMIHARESLKERLTTWK